MDDGDDMNAHFHQWGADAKQQPVGGLDLIDVGSWEGVTLPEREWVVPGWILPRAVTLISGAGGTGKSLLIQQWLSAIALGDGFMGTRGTAPVPALYVNCEDDAEELQRRQAAIAKTFNRRMASYAGQLHLVARLGMDNPIGVIGDDGKFKPNQFFDDIRDAALSVGAKVIALDNAMQLYVGNLNDPREVTVFCNALTRLAIETGAAVILAGHVAKAQGSEFAGTMAWENAVRMRLFLKRELDEKGEEVEDSDRRILTRGKANSARKGERLTMMWHEGAFHDESQIAGTEGRLVQEEVAFLRCLDAVTEQRRHVSHMPAANFAPKVFAAMPEASGVSRKALEQAMERLFASKEIVANEELWRDEKKRRMTYGLARNKAAQTPPKPKSPETDIDAVFEDKVAMFQEFARTSSSAQTTAQTLHQTPPKPRPNPAQTRPHTPLYTTYISGGADGTPTGEADYDLEAGPQPLPDDDGYLAAVQAELNDVPWYAPDDLTEFDNQEPLI
jgi:RecA-family ATPase